MSGVFDDQALFNAAMVRLEAKCDHEEAEPEPAVEETEAEPEEEPLGCPHFQEYFGCGPQHGSCLELRTKECLKCDLLDHRVALLANGDPYQWTTYDCEYFLQELGLVVTSDDGYSDIHGRVKSILETLRIVAKIVVWQDDS